MIGLEDSPHPVIHLPRFLLLSIVLYDAEYPVGQFGSVILLVVLSQLPVHLQPTHWDLDGKKKTLKLCCSAIP